MSILVEMSKNNIEPKEILNSLKQKDELNCSMLMGNLLLWMYYILHSQPPHIFYVDDIYEQNFFFALSYL